MSNSGNSNIISSRIINAARQYKTDFIGKTFLVFYEGKSAEIIFRVDNFMHLCGVGSNLSPQNFFKRAVKGQLNDNELYYNHNHPFSFANIKTQNLANALTIFKRDSLVVTDITTVTRNYKLGTTDLDVVLCFDMQLNANGLPKSDILYPYSLRIESIANNKYNNIYEVDYVLSKKTGSKEYTAVEFGNSDLLNEYMKENGIFEYSVNIANNGGGSGGNSGKKPETISLNNEGTDSNKTEDGENILYDISLLQIPSDSSEKNVTEDISNTSLENNEDVEDSLDDYDIEL